MEQLNNLPGRGITAPGTSASPQPLCATMRQSFILTAVVFGLLSCDQLSSRQGGRLYLDTIESPPMTNTSSERKQPPVLFVQWQFSSTTTGMQALDVRQKVEQEIDKALKASGQGQWFAGDLGPGGANMLFEVNDKTAALKIIQEILKEEGIEDETVIAERVYASPDDWTHKVIYPKDYKREFNDM